MADFHQLYSLFGVCFSWQHRSSLPCFRELFNYKSSTLLLLLPFPLFSLSHRPMCYPAKPSKTRCTVGAPLSGLVPKNLLCTGWLRWSAACFWKRDPPSSLCANRWQWHIAGKPPRRRMISHLSHARSRSGRKQKESEGRDLQLGAEGTIKSRWKEPRMEEGERWNEQDKHSQLKSKQMLSSSQTKTSSSNTF